MAFLKPIGPIGVVLALLFGATAATPASQVATAAPEAVVLITTFADGRTSRAVVTRTPRTSWTPLFPTLPGWRPPAGIPAVSALKFTRSLGADGAVTVIVAVLRGSSREREDPVTTVVVAQEDVVTVEALRDVGLAPVALSMTALTEASLHQPQVVNKTAGLEVTDVELVAVPRPHYRISVTNVASQAAMNFHVVTYRGGRRSLSGNRGNVDASPIVEAGGTYTFEMDPSGGTPPTNAGWAPAPHDAIEIAAALWEDGTIEGEPAPMAAALNLYAGRRALIERGLALLQRVPDASNPAAAKAWLKTGLERLSIEPDDTVQSRARRRLRHLDTVRDIDVVPTLRTAMADMRRRLIAELAGAPDDPAAFQQWLAGIAAKYQAWHQRLDSLSSEEPSA